MGTIAAVLDTQGVATLDISLKVEQPACVTQTATVNITGEEKVAARTDKAKEYVRNSAQSSANQLYALTRLVRMFVKDLKSGRSCLDA